MLEELWFQSWYSGKKIHYGYFWRSFQEFASKLLWCWFWWTNFIKRLLNTTTELHLKVRVFLMQRLKWNLNGLTHSIAVRLSCYEQAVYTSSLNYDAFQRLYNLSGGLVQVRFWYCLTPCRSGSYDGRLPDCFALVGYYNYEFKRGTAHTVPANEGWNMNLHTNNLRKCKG